MSFFKKVYVSIFGLENYKVLVDRGLTSAIKYIFKLLLITTLILSAALLYRADKTFNRYYEYLAKNFSDFEITNNDLVILEENYQDNEAVKKLEQNGIYIEPLKENLTDEEKQEIKQKAGNPDALYEIYVLKDKVEIELDSSQDTIRILHYDQICSMLGLKNDEKITKQDIVEYKMGGIEKAKVYVSTYLIVYFIVLIISIIFVTLGIIFVGLITDICKAFIVPIPSYKLTLIITIYSSTLATILLTGIYVYNILSGEIFSYSDFLYTTITLIYSIAAFLILKTDILNDFKRKILDTQNMRKQQQQEQQEEKENEEAENRLKQKQLDDVRKKDEEHSGATFSNKHQ